MAFCVKCGAQLAEGAKFCTGCGEATGVAGPANAKPAVEKVGDIRKCLNCGAEIGSFQTICPNCGQEYKNARVSNAIKEFTGKINELDEQISRTITDKAGKEEKKSPLVTIIVVSIFTLGIPLIIYLVLQSFKALPRLFFSSIPDLSPLEQQKKSIIENFIVPNTKEDIIEFILFSASKVEGEISHSGKSPDKTGITNMWIKVWANKCEQVYAKAGVALAGDLQTLAVVENIRKKPQQLVAAAKRNWFIKLAAAAAIIIAIGIAASGVLINVPLSATIPPENVTITGAFDGYIQAGEKGASLKANKDGTNIQMEIEFVSLKNFTPYLEKYIADFKNDKGWQKDNCTQELATYRSEIEIVLGDLKISTSNSLSSDMVNSTIST
jgi:hypothetical protein